jgi:hypothetical protein
MEDMMDMESVDRRLDVLEAENRALRAKIVELETYGFRMVIPVAKVTEGATIRYPVHDISGFVAPTKEELVALRRIIGSRYPDLACSDNCAKWSRAKIDLEHICSQP